LHYFKSYHLLHSVSSYPPQCKIFAFHPHGILSLSAQYCQMTDQFFDDTSLLGSSMAVDYPFGGLLLKSVGVESVRKQNFKFLMAK
jgi:hypothetical protein